VGGEGGIRKIPKRKRLFLDTMPERGGEIEGSEGVGGRKAFWGVKGETMGD